MKSESHPHLTLGSPSSLIHLFVLPSSRHKFTSPVRFRPPPPRRQPAPPLVPNRSLSPRLNPPSPPFVPKYSSFPPKHACGLEAKELFSRWRAPPPAPVYWTGAEWRSAIRTWSDSSPFVGLGGSTERVSERLDCWKWCWW